MSSHTNQETDQAILSTTGGKSGDSKSEPSQVDPNSNHPATVTQNPHIPSGKTTVLSDDDEEGIDDILCVAIGFYELPGPLDPEALLRLQDAVATMPAPELRKTFIALVDAIPETPDQVMRLWSPGAQVDTGVMGAGSGEWMCTRCFYTPTPHHHPWE